MNVNHRMMEMFRSYGASADGDRLKLYVEALTARHEHGKLKGQRLFNDTVILAACTRVTRSWERVSLPPIGVLFSACREVALADLEHKRQEQKERDKREGRAMSGTERLQCRIESQLFAAGLDWCDATGRWVPAGAAKHMDPEDERRYQPTIQQSRAALDAVNRGDLAGNEKIRAWRKRHGIGRALDQALGVTPAQSEVFD